MAELIWWLGAATETTAKVIVRSDTDGLITLTVNGQPYTDTSASGVNDGIVTLTAIGLNANNSYPLTIVHADASSESGALKTNPSAGSTYNFGWASCNKTTARVSAGYPLIDLNIAGFAHEGDLTYTNGASNSFGENTIDGDVDQTTANYYAYYRQAHRNPGIEHITQNAPFYYMSDDHEWHGDNWDQTATQANANGATAATQAEIDDAWNTENIARVAYSSGNPINNDVDAVAEKPSDHERASLADFGVITAPAANYPVMYCRWTIGDTEYFLLDQICYRSPLASTDNTSKTLLGAAQKAWLKARLLASTATFKVILSSKKLYANSGADNTDHWGAYTTERNELFAFIDSNAITTIVWLSGDRHTPEIQGTSKAGGDTYDTVCVVACPLGVEINSIQGTSGPETILLRPEWKNVFGIVQTNGSSFLRLQLRNSANGNIRWEGRVNAGSNVLV